MTARLSKLFYERLGEQATNELVDWFNAVDATYRAELRELNELNFGRFDAKVGQRFAEFEAKVDRRMSEFEAKIDRRMSEFEAKVERQFGDIRAGMADLKADLVKWMFLFWAGTALAGLLFR